MSRPSHWPGATALAFDPEPDGGAVLVTAQYAIAADTVTQAFLERPWSTLVVLGAKNRRYSVGALSGLLTAPQPGLVELFSVPSWQEHARQHEGAHDGHWIKTLKRPHTGNGVC
mgnify:CR=1 FL=1